MEDVHRTHKEVPTGWVLWLKAVAELVAEDRRARDGAPGGEPSRFHGLPTQSCAPR